ASRGPAGRANLRGDRGRGGTHRTAGDHRKLRPDARRAPGDAGRGFAVDQRPRLPLLLPRAARRPRRHHGRRRDGRQGRPAPDRPPRAGREPPACGRGQLPAHPHGRRRPGPGRGHRHRARRQRPSPRVPLPAGRVARRHGSQAPPGTGGWRGSPGAASGPGRHRGWLCDGRGRGRPHHLAPARETGGPPGGLRSAQDPG
ncbi:MAG: Possibly 2,5-diamino-6-ribosylamino-pyrimidinone 5-phosphate reductase, fungal, partial [uncultured Rubrobacteraceae bacterium]